jgi:hypothetical protein|tara:strand:- start:158 stop:376 length:219 start_codon:yes stop_codon:yes gene_type:complete
LGYYPDASVSRRIVREDLSCFLQVGFSRWLFVSAYESSPSSVSLLRVEELLLLPGEGRRKDLFLPWEGGRYS